MVSANSLKLPSTVCGQFSGHETFPLRQLWLSKITRSINNAKASGVPIAFTTDVGIEHAILELGIGKNMVSSARFWTRACCVIDEADRLTDIGKLIFGDANKAGADPYCVNVASIWLMHWNLASVPERFTPIWFLFNHVNQPSLDRQSFVDGMRELCRINEWKVSDNTLRRAQECTLRAYLPRLSSKGNTEDFVEPLLAELGLLETTASRDVFLINRGAHRSHPDEIFIYALMDYWVRLGNQTASLDFARIAHDFGSPGRVFKLDNENISKRLQRLGEITKGNLEWTEQAGLRQVIRRKKAHQDPFRFAMDMLKKAYQA